MSWHLRSRTLSLGAVQVSAPANQPEPDPMIPKTVTLTLAGTLETALPAGKTFAGFKFSLGVKDAADPPAEVQTQETTVQFSDAAPGTYVATVAAVDQDGAPLGPVQSIEVVVPDTPSFPAPTGLSATVA